MGGQTPGLEGDDAAAGIMSIQRPYNWAEELGYIDENPVRKIKKPPCGRREQAVTPDQWQKIRDHYPAHDPFRDLLEFCWETGCRPFEARSMEIRHVQLDKQLVLFKPEEAKGKTHCRVIRLTQTAVEIVKRRMGARSEGVVFLNDAGNAWTACAMNCRFCRLKKHVGVKFFAYAWRHGFATRKLVEGHDHLTVAELMGHTDGTMLARVYAASRSRGGAFAEGTRLGQRQVFQLGWLLFGGGFLHGARHPPLLQEGIQVIQTDTKTGAATLANAPRTAERPP